MVKNKCATHIAEIKITLKNIKPAIWRRVHVPSDITLAQLHQVIQIAMGWTNSHLHQFVIDGKSYSSKEIDDDFGHEMADESHVKLDQVAEPKSHFIYEYDFGDDWQHEIRVEKMIAHQTGIKTPYCVAGERACPPEDCGGVWGYVDMLEKLADPACEERAELIEWVGGEFDPEKFDRDEVNEHLKHLQK